MNATNHSPMGTLDANEAVDFGDERGMTRRRHGPGIRGDDLRESLPLQIEVLVEPAAHQGFELWIVGHGIGNAVRIK